MFLRKDPAFCCCFLWQSTSRYFLGIWKKQKKCEVFLLVALVISSCLTLGASAKIRPWVKTPEIHSWTPQKLFEIDKTLGWQFSSQTGTYLLLTHRPTAIMSSYDHKTHHRNRMELESIRVSQEVLLINVDHKPSIWNDGVCFFFPTKSLPVSSAEPHILYTSEQHHSIHSTRNQSLQHRKATVISCCWGNNNTGGWIVIHQPSTTSKMHLYNHQSAQHTKQVSINKCKPHQKKQTT